MKKILYRYETFTDGNDYESWLVPKLKEIPVIRSTPKGYWIKKTTLSPDHRTVINSERWISNCGKQAQETPEEAMFDFMRRRRKTISLLKWRIEMSERVIDVINLTKRLQICEEKEFPEKKWDEKKFQKEMRAWASCPDDLHEKVTDYEKKLEIEIQFYPYSIQNFTILKNKKNAKNR